MSTLKTLGTADEDALAIESKALFSTEELKEKAQAERARRIEAGIADDVENVQPIEAPAFDQSLVGKRIEVRWKYYNKDTGEPMFVWSPGRVARVADGLTDKRSARARKILPAGALLWAWDADPAFDERAGEQWLVLLPDKWNKQVHYGWRFDPRELASVQVEAPASGSTSQQVRGARAARRALAADGSDLDEGQ